MRGNPKNVCVGGYRYIHKISECEVMKLVRPFLCVVCLLVLSSIHQYLFIICRVHDHLLSLASPLVPDESGSSGGKTPIAAPPPTFASGNLNEITSLLSVRLSRTVKYILCTTKMP